ncbi:MAG: insulinase family protein [Clostridia bacterium]|nr:insulinase family protein [Clostridia bacterium]
MKRFLQMTTAAATAAVLALGSVGFADALPEENLLPAVGDVVEGFEVIETRPFGMIGADVTLFEHQATGAKLVYIANEDTNRVFDLVFLTRPLDETGLPHVFEHATLSGSEKYPSESLFFNLSYQTYNTYMNASTYSVMTSYPVASLSEEQLLKYADFYTDSCLHPMILENEDIYRTEAWRYRMASMEDPLTIEGTVYSEMLGSMTLSRQAGYNFYKTAFPGSVVGLNHGGDPDHIPEMTWDALKAYHDRFYHPSNSVAYLYGQFDDYTAFLALLNEAFAPYEKQEFQFVDADYTPITSPVTASLPYAVENGTNTQNISVIQYAFVCPGLRDDADEEMILNTLTDLLVSSASPLMIKLRRVLPAGSFACYIDTTSPDAAIVFTANNVNAEDAELFKATVDEALADVAANGFDGQLVDTVMASTALAIRLTGESADLGVNIIPSLAYDYAVSGDVFSYMDYVDALGNMEAWNSEGHYMNAVNTWLIGNERTALVSTYPVAGAKEAHDAALAEALAALKETMTDEEKQAIIDATNAVKEPDDASEYVRQLQAVTVESLPEEIVTYDVKDEMGEDGIRRVETVAGVEQVGRAGIWLDIKGLPQEGIHAFKLYTDLVGEMDTTSHTHEELNALIERYLYGVEFRLSLLDSEEEDYIPYLRMGFTAMDDDLEEAYDLLHELAFETDFSDVERLKEVVSAAKTSLRATINSQGYNMLLYRAMAVTDESWRYYNYINYLDYYAFLEAVESALDQNPEAVIAMLQGIEAAVNNSTNALYAFAGNEESIALSRTYADAFFASLGKEEIEHEDYDLPVPARREGIILDTNVNFNSLIADYEALDMEDYNGSLDVISTLVSDMFLIPQLRDQYGVYTPFSGATDSVVYMLTYRDPNIAETYDVYASIGDQLEAMDVDQETLDGYILSSYAYYAKSSGELTGAFNALVNALNGTAQDETLGYMRDIKAVTPDVVKASAEMYRALNANGIRSTVGSASAINGNASRYDVILNPFNAVDTSKVEFTDAAEGSEHYDAVRFAFEEGLMAAKADDAFGTDDTATLGELSEALYVLIGGTLGTPDEAVATFQGYGIVPADVDKDQELTKADVNGVMVNFGAAVGMPIEPLFEEEAAEEPATRADIAEIMYALFSE